MTACVLGLLLLQNMDAGNCRTMEAGRYHVMYRQVIAGGAYCETNEQSLDAEGFMIMRKRVEALLRMNCARPSAFTPIHPCCKGSMNFNAVGDNFQGICLNTFSIVKSHSNAYISVLPFHQMKAELEVQPIQAPTCSFRNYDFNQPGS